MSGHAGERPPAAGSGKAAAAASGRSRGLPVDRGWAWVIVAASCGIFGLQAGSFKISGLLYVQLVEHFGSDPRLTAWVISTSALVSLSAGPMVSLLLSKTSHRFVAVTGCILMASGAISTAYVPIIEATFFTHGLIYGLGMTCMHIASLTCTVPYFDRHRGLAIGLITAGSGVMSFVLPNVMTALFEAYMFSGAMLIYAGIILQAAVLGCLLRPPSMYTERQSNLLAPRDSRDLRRLPPRTHSATRDEPRDNGKTAQAESRDEVIGWNPQNTAQVGDADLSEIVWVKKPVDAKRNVEEEATAEGKKNAPTAPPPSAASARKLIDCSLLKSERMWMIGLIMLLATSGMNIVFVAMAPHGEAIGLPRAMTSMLISIGGALEIVCRGLHGWFSDRHLMPVLAQFGLCTGLTGLSAVLCPIIGGAAGLGLLSAMCGAFGTTVYALAIVLMRELLGADKVMSAMGIQMFFQAASLIVSTLAIAFITEAYGSWEYIFYYIGGNMILSSTVCVACALILNVREKRKARG